MFTLDLRERPFTDRGSRLLVTAGEDGSLRVARALYETRLSDTTVIRGLRLFDGSRELPVRRATPDLIEFEGGVSLAFADPETLALSGSGAVARWDGGEVAVDGCVTFDGRRLERDVPGQAAARWGEWFSRMPAVPEELRERAEMAWWTLAVNLVRIRGRESLIPSKYGYVGLWNWDSYFHAIGLRHAEPELAREQIRILLDNQRPDGLIPDVVHDHGVLAETTDLPRSDLARLAQHVGGEPIREPVPVTKPPLTAWAVWKIHEADPDVGFLGEVYERLVRSQEWWFARSDPDGDGLAEYLHPYSSGLDDSPIWDHGPRAEPPDLNSYLALQYDRLADIAEVLGKSGDATMWREKAQAVVDLLVARRWNGTRFVTPQADVRTPLDLMPLFTGRLPADVARRLVDDLLSASFWGERPVPTVAFDDPRFEPDVMWRGPVWLNVNYLLIDGLRRSGFHAEAAELRERTLAMVRDGGGLYEYWNPATGGKATRATTGFGWSAALFLDLAQESSPNAPRDSAISSLATSASSSEAPGSEAIAVTTNVLPEAERAE
ncbi:amylo-alpha-1,6-glucosidase [Nonomuraea sediminis]|uniref:amylo-alpha-1,6-glucosidase n=1 Tax=Nonomuraea sediminis TaxID=2835864 RepID=UPI00202A0B90|nr:glycogen debranching protein [Nonomuraea sediminis]